MAHNVNKIIAADSVIDDADMEPPENEREEEIDDASVLDADDMYEIESERSPARKFGEKANKGKGAKTASKSAKDDEWKPANTLDAPTPRPGMIQRWIRHQSPGPEGAGDAKNWSRAMREGWVPRAINTVPEGFDAPTGKHGSSGGTVIMIGDLILCEMPLVRYRSRRKYFREKLQRQLAAITKRPLSMAESLNGPRIQVEDKHSATFGRRRRAAATDED
jgi:hypothetical protein